MNIKKYHVKKVIVLLFDQICLPVSSDKGNSAVLKSKCFFFNIK